MTGLCGHRTHDKWRTVWECAFDEGHDGMCGDGTIRWAGPGSGPEPEYKLRVRPLHFFQWTGHDSALELAGAIEEGQFAVEIRDYQADFDSATIHGIRIGESRPHGMFVMPGEWVVGYSDRTVDVIAPDRFTRMFAATEAAGAN